MKWIGCQRCPKRKTCFSLCHKAEKYVSQDTINENPDVTPTDTIDELAPKLPEGVGTIEAMLQNYFIDRMESKEIAIRYGYSKRYVNRTIKKYKIILIQNIKKSVPT